MGLGLYHKSRVKDLRLWGGSSIASLYRATRVVSRVLLARALPGYTRVYRCYLAGSG